MLKNPLPALCEPKLDGIRAFFFKSGDKLVLSSRHGELYTPKSSPKVFAKVPEFTHAPHRMILDGEYVSKEGLFLFDVLQVDERDVRVLPLTERKKILREILHGTDLEITSKLAKASKDITDYMDEVVGKGGEGLVVKNPSSAYGETNAWLKLKRFDTVDVFVIDYEETQEMKRTGVARSWYVGVYDDDDGQQVNLGKIGAFVESVDPRKVVLGSVVEVRFQQLTEDKKLRGAFVLRVRHDKTPQECLLSQFK